MHVHLDYSGNQIFRKQIFFLMLLQVLSLGGQ